MCSVLLMEASQNVALIGESAATSRMRDDGGGAALDREKGFRHGDGDLAVVVRTTVLLRLITRSDLARLRSMRKEAGRAAPGTLVRCSVRLHAGVLPVLFEIAVSWFFLEPTKFRPVFLARRHPPVRPVFWSSAALSRDRVVGDYLAYPNMLGWRRGIQDMRALRNARCKADNL
jgi:hypothetical protein